MIGISIMTENPMENQHKKIKGYRDLSQYEIDLMNKIKAKGNELGELVVEVQRHITNQRNQCCVVEQCIEVTNQDEYERLCRAEPERFANIAKSELQTGIMHLVRAIAQPEGF